MSESVDHQQHDDADDNAQCNANQYGHDDTCDQCTPDIPHRDGQKQQNFGFVFGSARFFDNGFGSVLVEFCKRRVRVRFGLGSSSME